MKRFFSNQLIILAITIVAVYSFQGCKEIYEPELNHDMQYLVVDGMITNLEGPHEVKLSKTNVFGQDYEHIPVKNASVRIVDSGNNEVLLEEKKHGSYFTPDNFAGEINETYTLYITTEDGKNYKSAPQELLAPVSIDSFYGELSSETFFYQSQNQGTINSKEVEGVNLFIDASSDEERIPKFRYNTKLMLQYRFKPEGAEDVTKYCWEIRDITYIIGSDLIENLSIPESERNRVSFLPNRNTDMRYIGFPVFKTDTTIVPSPFGDENDQIPIIYMQPRIFSLNIYALNDDAYSFYYERYKQTSDEGRFFDPISPQITGNMHCEDDQEEIVLGFFEASAVALEKTYLVRTSNIIEHLEFFEMPECSDCSWDEEPYWWFY